MVTLYSHGHAMCTVFTAEQVEPCQEVSDAVGEDDVHGMEEYKSQPDAEEDVCGDSRAGARDTDSNRGSVHSAQSRKATTPAGTDKVEMNRHDDQTVGGVNCDVDAIPPKEKGRKKNRHDEETPKKSIDECITTTALTKPDQKATKTGTSRTRNTSNKKAWKPAGPMTSKKEAPRGKSPPYCIKLHPPCHSTWEGGPSSECRCSGPSATDIRVVDGKPRSTKTAGARGRCVWTKE